jgi:hypothetical protein
MLFDVAEFALFRLRPCLYPSPYRILVATGATGVKSRFLLWRHDFVILMMTLLAGLDFSLLVPGMVAGRAFRETQVGMSLVMESHSTGLALESDRLLALRYRCRVDGSRDGSKEQGDNDVLKFHCVFLKSPH